MPPKIDLIAFDFQLWKNDESSDIVPVWQGTIRDAINGLLQAAFSAGWEYRDQRATVGKPKETEQQEGRTGLGGENGRSRPTKLGKKVAQKVRHEKRRVSH